MRGVSPPHQDGVELRGGTGRRQQSSSETEQASHVDQARLRFTATAFALSVMSPLPAENVALKPYVTTACPKTPLTPRP